MNQNLFIAFVVASGIVLSTCSTVSPIDDTETINDSPVIPIEQIENVEPKVESEQAIDEIEMDISEIEILEEDFTDL